MRERGEGRFPIGTMILTPDHGTVLWALRSRGDEVAAVVRLYRAALELTYLWNGQDHFSQMFENEDALLAAAREKRQELEANGWKADSASAPVRG